jgi:hypothetical protein
MARKTLSTVKRSWLVSVRVEPLEERTFLSSVGWDGAGTGSAALTYFIGDVPTHLDQANVDAALERALAEWADVVEVTFTETSAPNQLNSIDFSFAPIDGGGGTLAQAYLPDDVNSARIAGNIQFDSSETWEIGDANSSAFDLVLVAVHEIGHALGLEHLLDARAVMAPSVSPTQSYQGLSRDDVDAALALYAPVEIESPDVGTDPGPASPDSTLDRPAPDLTPTYSPAPRETPWFGSPFTWYPYNPFGRFGFGWFVYRFRFVPLGFGPPSLTFGQ